MTLPKPKSQVQRILRDLITRNKGVTESAYNYHNFRGYISGLRKLLNLKHIDKPFKNSFGRDGKYRVHFITDSEKKKATKLYLSLTK